MPFKRNTNYRRTPALRELLAETRLHASDFIYPIFLIPGKNQKKEIASMPDIYQFSLDLILAKIEKVLKKGVKAFLIFGVPNKKDLNESYDQKNFLVKGIQKIRKTFPEIILISDICLCSYTSHGHCGVLAKDKIDNDKTIKILAKMAAAHAMAGADIVAPSAMRDGQVSAIRSELDNQNQKQTLILSYAAKFASNFYGPFRDAAQCRPSFEDRTAYQLPIGNTLEALNKVENDVNEGANMLMVKPALAYLDIIAKVKENYNLPLAAYNTSGEYAMLKNIQKKDLKQGQKIILETLLSMKRAGANMIISYHAREIDKIIL